MASQQVNAQRLKEAGNNLSQLSQKIKQELTKLDENLQKVSSIWTGDASASYLKMYQADKANLTQLYVALQEAGDTMTEMSGEYVHTDNKALDAIARNLGKGK